MCAPAVLAGVSMLSTFMSLRAQNQQIASAANAAGRSAVSNALFNYSQINDRTREEQLQASQQRMLRMRQGLRERAAMAVNLGEAGVAGNTPSRDAIASAIWQAEDMGVTDLNLEIAKRQLEGSKRGVHAGVMSDLNSVKSMKSQSVPEWQMWLRTGLSGFEGYYGGKKLTAPFESRGTQTSLMWNPRTFTYTKGGR